MKSISARRRQGGMTLPEVVIGASISSIVLFVGVSCFLTCMTSWIRGQAYINSETNANEALRRITSELKEAMNVAVSESGGRVDYQKPLTDGNGNYLMPIQPDGVTRTIRLNSGTLQLTRGGTTWDLCTNVLSTDPNLNATYKIFKANTGFVTRQIVVTLVTRSYGYKNEQISGRVREMVFLRNIPEVTK